MERMWKSSRGGWRKKITNKTTQGLWKSDGKSDDIDGYARCGSPRCLMGQEIRPMKAAFSIHELLADKKTSESME